MDPISACRPTLMAESRVKNRLGSGGSSYPNSFSVRARGPGCSTRPSMSIVTSSAGGNASISRASGSLGTMSIVSRTSSSRTSRLASTSASRSRTS